MLNCAVIGVGSMGRNHARIYSQLSNVNLVAVSDPNEKQSQAIAKNYGCESYTDYEEMIEKEEIDIVSIVVPTELHFKVATFCMEKGINVLLEKPITSTIEEGKKLIALAKEKELKFMIGHIERFNPAIRELKKMIDDGELGKVFKIDVNRVGPFPARIRDVGVVIDLAVHDLDIMRYLTDSEAESVYALTEKQIHTSHEDLLSGLVRFKNKTICNLNINWLTPTKIRKLYITGEKGMFVADYLKQDLYYYENAEIKNGINYSDILRGVSEGKMVKYPIQKKEPLLTELEHFIDCVENDETPLISGEDGLKALELAQKLIKSGDEGSVE